MLMVINSGQQNRNEEQFGHNPFAVIADSLVGLKLKMYAMTTLTVLTHIFSLFFQQQNSCLRTFLTNPVKFLDDRENEEG